LIEKALYVIIFMYSVSFSILGIQYVLGDTFNITLQNFDGQPIHSSLLEVINTQNINTALGNVTTANYTATTTDEAFAIASGAAVELFLLMTGTYIFNMLFLLGIPAIFIAGFVVLYGILFARAVLGYIRGI